MESLGNISDPAAHLRQIIDRSEAGAWSFSIMHPQPYLRGKPHTELHVACICDGTQTACVVTDNPGMIEASRNAGNIEALEKLANTFNVGVMDLHAPQGLQTLRIDKPWGAEIWYTGIEERGVCRANHTPLPWILAATGELWFGKAPGELVLLKILDPRPEPVLGDLYFEMHEQKREVYVVTHVDEQAWPDGVGGIRFGFNAHKLASHVSLASFKEDYLDTVNRYREIRQQIDDRFDEFRQAEGISADAVVSPALIAAWNRRLDPALVDRESQYRGEIDAYSDIYPLRVGDVVQVPQFTPHALQHGVRVVEFQTPHYERFILSFGQKVLTQPHWDTAEAIDKVNWQASFEPEIGILESTGDRRVERIADFDAFEVQRVTLAEGARYASSLSTYALVMGITGTSRVNGRETAPEDACLIPALARELVIEAVGGPALALIALPKQLQV